jgi:hypothetical protein
MDSIKRHLPVAIGEWLMVLPATMLLGEALMRSAGGRGPPARMSWFISDWASTHISHLGAGLVFIGVGLLAAATLLAAAILTATIAHVITAGRVHGRGAARSHRGSNSRQCVVPTGTFQKSVPHHARVLDGLRGRHTPP